MGSFSDYQENATLDNILEANNWVALCTADPTDAGTGASMNEVPDSNSYARAAVTAATWDAASGGSKTTGTAITFPEATGSWGTITHFAIVDSGTYGAGNMRMHGALSASKTISNGDTPRFSAGDLTITLD